MSQFHLLFHMYLRHMLQCWLFLPRECVIHLIPRALHLLILVHQASIYDLHSNQSLPKRHRSVNAMYLLLQHYRYRHIHPVIHRSGHLHPDVLHKKLTHVRHALVLLGRLVVLYEFDNHR